MPRQALSKPVFPSLFTTYCYLWSRPRDFALFDSKVDQILRRRLRACAIALPRRRPSGLKISTIELHFLSTVQLPSDL
ncbi:hypothetical protein PCANC_06228 [Puccinia coronata f. sp. avenae]|uniref:Uncharacterized protein n=1 Tax=Puccinia coronata f. sp. avenae TaxID=200324 RepID=A0A2N5V337_9BASI|nr:hypothetical protein PCASD_05743 [Puccinia coronata f. sp. avenae]PLW44429.1 hypothetical protein PCANC_06228 [Puccinia coronata f. sp. avenae]